MAPEISVNHQSDQKEVKCTYIEKFCSFIFISTDKFQKSR